MLGSVEVRVQTISWLLMLGQDEFWCSGYWGNSKFPQVFKGNRHRTALRVQHIMRPAAWKIEIILYPKINNTKVPTLE